MVSECVVIVIGDNLGKRLGYGLRDISGDWDKSQYLSYSIPMDPLHPCIKIQLQLSYCFSSWIFNTIKVYRDGGWEKIPKGTLRLRLQTWLPSPASWLLAGIWCRQPSWMPYPQWNLISLGHNSCISYMHAWGYNTCNLNDETDASVYVIDWIPTSPAAFHWSWLIDLSPYT